MNNRKRPAESSSSANLVFCSSSFQRQPARVLIVDALPPWWSDTRVVICDALDNFLSLACGLDGPCRIPLLSLYAVSRQQECLLPFVVHGNLARLRSCVEELRSIPGEGCIRGTARGGELLLQTVLDSLQQFKQYMRHTSTGNPSGNNISVEVTVVTSQPGQAVVHQLEMGLKDADQASLKRLLVVHIYSTRDWSQVGPLPEVTPTETEVRGCLEDVLQTSFWQLDPDIRTIFTQMVLTTLRTVPCLRVMLHQKQKCLMLGTEVDMQQVENNVFSVETVLKAWLQEQGGDREHLHLLLPNHSETPVCVKCDVQERLISPALIPLSPALGAKTESVQDFLPVSKHSASQNPPQRLKVIKSLRADGVCESMMYGLPLVLCPTACWQLDWEEMEANHNLFHALCHTLRSRDLFLLLQVEPDQRSAAEGSGVYSHYILQPSPSLSLLLKPVVSRELLLPCSLPVSNQDPVPDAMHTVQGCLTQLDEEFLFNPLSLSSNLYQHLRSRGLRSQPRYPYRLQPVAAHREQCQAAEGPKSTGSRRQNQGRQLGTNSRARATVAPLPSSSSSSSLSSSVRPPPAKASRPALMLLSSSGSRRAPPPSQQDEGSKDDDSMVAQ